MMMRWLWRMIAVTTLVGTLSAACRKSTVSDKPPSASVSSPAASAKCEVSIAQSALEGCRAPNQPGCEFCWDFQANGLCRIRSGHRHDGELWVYTSASPETDCPAEGPRCARCMRNSEAVLRDAPRCRECDCRIDPGIDPCIVPDGCGCYCSA